LASALFALAMVTIAARPADEDHPFGHTKAEYFSSAFEGLMIAAAAIAIAWAAIGRFLHPQPLESVGVGLALSIVSSALNGLLAARMLAESRRHRSIALEADARHLYTDVWTSAGVVVGVVAVQLTGWLWLDPAVAIGVAINIIREGARVVWVSVDGLMDKALEPDVQERIDRTLARFAETSVRFDDLVTRRAGLQGGRSVAVIGLVQRVAEARVTVAGRVVGSIGRGLLLFVCAEPDDSDAIADRFAAKVLALRVFADDVGTMNLDLAAVGGALLVVSQFTLAADTSRGNRPSFIGAAGAERGRTLYERVVAAARR